MRTPQQKRERAWRDRRIRTWDKIMDQTSCRIEGKVPAMWNELHGETIRMLGKRQQFNISNRVLDFIAQVVPSIEAILRGIETYYREPQDEDDDHWYDEV